MTKITKSAFGEFEGKPVERYTLSEGEMSVSVLTYGGILQSIVLPDKNGENATSFSDTIRWMAI